MLATALASIRAQRWPKVQIIVVDGGSTDGTIEQCAASSWIELISGPDRGIYDALNKGLAAATGDIIGFLNTDDVYGENVFRAVAQSFDAHPHALRRCRRTAVIEEVGWVVATFDRDLRQKG